MTARFSHNSNYIAPTPCFLIRVHMLALRGIQNRTSPDEWNQVNHAICGAIARLKPRLKFSPPSSQRCDRKETGLARIGDQRSA